MAPETHPAGLMETLGQQEARGRRWWRQVARGLGWAALMIAFAAAGVLVVTHFVPHARVSPWVVLGPTFALCGLLVIALLRSPPASPAAAEQVVPAQTEYRTWYEITPDELPARLGIGVPEGGQVHLEHVSATSKRVTAIGPGHTLVLRITWTEKADGET